MSHAALLDVTIKSNMLLCSSSHYEKKPLR